MMTIKLSEAVIDEEEIIKDLDEEELIKDLFNIENINNWSKEEVFWRKWSLFLW